MQSDKMGPFICALRKERRMTQKELAAKLNITDKAVSKWERGLSCPDIALLPPLADLLGVTVAELLNAERGHSDSAECGAVPEKAAERRARPWQEILAFSFSILLFLGAFVCAICDLAVNRSFTWSVFSISSILFAWCVLFPAVRYGAAGIRFSLLLCSVLILPFLYVLGCLTPVSIKITLLSILFAWAGYFVCKKWKEKIFQSAGILLLLAACLHLAIQLVLL